MKKYIVIPHEHKENFISEVKKNAYNISLLFNLSSDPPS